MYCMYKNDYLKKVTKDWNTIDWVPIFEWAIPLNWFDSCLNAWAECMSKFQKVSKNKTHILTLQNSSSNSRKGVRKFDGIFKMPGCDSLCAVKDVLNCSTTDVRLCFCYSPTVGISCYKQKLLTPPTFWRGVFSAGFTPLKSEESLLVSCLEFHKEQAQTLIQLGSSQMNCKSL